MNAPFELQPGVVTDVPLDVIDFDREQPRKHFDEGEIDELAASIAADGLKQPVTLRPRPDFPGRYLIVMGERRTRAHLRLRSSTIRALLADERDCADDLSRFLTQVKENYHRSPLDPIELAGVLDTLHQRFGLSSASKIEEALKNAGIPSMSRSYVANMRRLLQLPDWAQELIRKGAKGFTASHGKYLLPALDSETVLARVRAAIEAADHWTTSQLENAIKREYIALHKNLSAHWVTPFDAAGCVGCRSIREIGGEKFCLDSACHQAKKETHLAAVNAENAARRSLRPATVIDGVVDVEAQCLRPFIDFVLLVDASFDVAQCRGCTTRHATANGGDGCFNPECFRSRTAQAGEAEKSAREYVRAEIIAHHAASDATLQLQLLGWLALQRPCGRDGDETLTDHEWYGSADDELQSVLSSTGLHSLRDVLERGAIGHADAIAALAVRVCDDCDLVELSRRAKVKIPKGHKSGWAAVIAAGAREQARRDALAQPVSQETSNEASDAGAGGGAD